MANLRRVDAKQVIELLEGALPNAVEPVLAFDADGTLWRGDVGCDLFKGAIEERIFTDQALELFRSEARSIGVSDEGDVIGVAQTLLDAFHSGHWDDGPAALTMAIGFVGVDPKALTALAEKTMANVDLDARIHPGVVEIIAWATHHDVPTYVVSASPIAAVVAGARRLGIPEERMIAMRPAIQSNGTLAMTLASENVYGEGKVRALAAAIPHKTILGAFGDSAGDAFMMRKARVPVAVGPSPGLLAIADSVPGLYELPFPALAE